MGSETKQESAEVRMREIEHFITLARRGKPNTCASGGEVRARKLAMAIIENAPGLDFEASAGAAAFVEFAANNPQAARAMIEDQRRAKVGAR